MKAFINLYVRSLPPTLPLALAAIALVTTVAEGSSTKPTFEFTCETAESDVYDWIETEFWPKGTSSVFGRNLDAAFDVLTSTPKNAWEVILPESECTSDVLLESRREALYLMLEDAAQDGYGTVSR